MNEMERRTDAALAKLEPRLRQILGAELAAGNRVTGGSEWAFEFVEVMVHVARPFLVKQDPLPAGVKQVDVNDAHYWKAEYQVEVPCERGEKAGRACYHVLACGFATE